MAAAQARMQVGRSLVGTPLFALTDKTCDDEKDPPIYLDWNATTPIFPEVCRGRFAFRTLEYQPLVPTRAVLLSIEIDRIKTTCELCGPASCGC